MGGYKKITPYYKGKIVTVTKNIWRELHSLLMPLMVIGTIIAVCFIIAGFIAFSYLKKGAM